MKSYAQLLALPGQRRLLLASIPADFADWLDYIAVIALLVYGWQQGPFTLALMALTVTAPHVLIGPWLAALVDRADLKQALLLSNLGRGMATAALIFVPNVPLLLLVLFLRGVADTAFTPARQAAIQRLTPTALLPAANGLHQGVNQTSKIIGPALGGLLLGLIPVQAIFAVNAALSLIAVLVLLGIRLPTLHDTAPPDEPLVTRLTAGFAEFLSNRKLLAVLIFSASAYFGFFLYDTIIALLAADLGYDKSLFGLTITASGLGGLLGAAIAGSLGASRPLLMMTSAALLNAAVTLTLAWGASRSLAIPFPLFCLAMGLMGGCTAFMTVPYRSVIQAETPPDRLARVFSAGEAVTISVMMAAPFIGSLIAAQFGVPAAFMAGGVVLAALGIVALVPALRR
ncbi:MAG: MFS transporter [Devosia sp.]